MRQIIDASPSRSQAAQRPPRCRGSFWDSQRGCAVSIDLGNVNLTVPSVFRAASLEDEPKNILSWEIGFSEEGAAQSACGLSYEGGFTAPTPNGKKYSGEVKESRTLLISHMRPSSTEQSFCALGQKMSGSYVIPGHSLTG